MSLKIALDRAAVNRQVDDFGKLHVRVSNISKATVNDYIGNEIPGFEELGLDPNKVYKLLRDPEELAKAAPTFNNLPLLDRHVPVTVDAPQQEFIVGSTGTDAEFDGTYLKNSLVIWTAGAIAGVESRQEQELSCAYAYKPDMTEGTFEGLHYDGIMRNIIGNHVALVSAGRAGPNVVVGDSKPELPAVKLSTRTALLASGAIIAAVRPMLAQDAKVDFSASLKDVTRGNFKASKPAIIASVTAATKGKLAQDADLGPLNELLDKLAGEVEAIPEEDDEIPATDAEEDGAGKAREFLAGKLSAEDMAAYDKLCGGAMDEDDETMEGNRAEAEAGPKKPPGGIKVGAADAAKIAQDAENRAVVRMQALAQAREDVEPHVGKVSLALDSAAKVYKLALDHAKVDTAGVPEAAYGAMVRMLPKPQAAPETLAFDSAGGARAEFDKMFPTASKLI